MTSPGPPNDVKLEALARGIAGFAMRSSPNDFQAGALALLSRLVPFDASFWGIASMFDGIPRPYGVHMDRISHQAILEYPAIREVDVVGRWVMANPGRTLHFDVRTADASVPRAILDFDRRHDIEQILCTMVPETGTDSASYVSLYRSPGAPTFTEAERATVEAILPGIVAGFAASRARAGLDW